MAMKDVKITVVESAINEKLMKEYGKEGVGICPIHQVGQEWVIQGVKKPDDFCGGAWGSFEKYIFALAHGLEEFQFAGGWMKHKNISINTCNDGIRPVTFKIEAIEAK